MIMEGGIIFRAYLDMYLHHVHLTLGPPGGGGKTAIQQSSLLNGCL